MIAMFDINMMTRMMLIAEQICYALVCMGRDDADYKTIKVIIN